MLGVVTAATLALAGCSGPDTLDVDTDHRTAAEPPEPLADSGPPPGRFEQLWEITLEDAPHGYHLLGGHLIVATETGVQAYDVRTGEARWHYHEPGRALWGIAASDDVIVLDSSRREVIDGDTETLADDHLVGLDARTGELLWERADEWSLLIGGVSGARELHELGDAEGGVVVVEPDFRERAGLDAHTGDERWRVGEDDVSDRCAAENAGASDANRVVVLTTIPCDSPSNKVAVVLDAESGEMNWRRPLSPGASYVDVDNQAGVTLLGSGDRPPALIGPTGEELYTGEDGSSCVCKLYRAGDQVVLKYVAVDGGDAWVSVDPAGGAVTRLQDWADIATAAPSTTAGSAVYGFIALPSLLPWMVAITDVTTGDTATAPLPVPTTDIRPVTWLGASGDLLVVVRTAAQPGTSTPGATTITAHRSVPTDGPVELGGVSPDEWPDPCELLDGTPEGDDDRQRGIHESGDPLQVGSATIPRTWCTVRLVDYDTATVSVSWVAATEEEAAILADNAQPDPAAQLTVPGADVAWTVQDRTFLQVGKTIAAVSTTAPHRTRDAVLETVTDNLHAAR